MGLIQFFRSWRDARLLKLHYHLRNVAEREMNREIQYRISRLKSCGKGVVIRGPIHFTGEKSTEIGNNVHIGSNAFIRADGGLSIGDNTVISRNLLLYTTNHRYDGERLPYDKEYVAKPVRIGRNVWIGMNVCIAPGTIIGDGAIVGMGTTVAGEVPPLAIIASQKWRIIGERDSAHYNRLDQNRQYSDPFGNPLDFDD